VKRSWSHAIEMVTNVGALGDRLVVTGATLVEGLDLGGKVLWREELVGTAGPPIVSNDIVVVSVYQRNRPSLAIAFDRDGAERWRYERAWSLVNNGIVATETQVVLAGNEHKTNAGRWVFLDPRDGSSLGEVAAPSTGTPHAAGKWLVAQIDEGRGGLVRTDADGANPQVITRRSHSMLAAAGETTLIGTWDHDDPPRIVAIDVATGAERWDREGAENLGFGVDGTRVAWMEAAGEDRIAVIGDVTTGNVTWRSEPMPSTDDGFELLLGDDLVVVYAGFERASTFRPPKPTAVEHRSWDRFHGDGLVIGHRFYEVGGEGLTCWDLR
jgi:outer membrane protein assembly factor BamB